MNIFFSNSSSSSNSASAAAAAGGSEHHNEAKSKPAEVDPQDIPKEELMALCMKLNKRMQSLEGRYNELRARKQTLLNERKALIELISSEVSINVAILDEQDIPLDEFRDKWSERRRENAEQLNSLKLRVSKAESAATSNSSTTDEAQSPSANTVSYFSNNSNKNNNKIESFCEFYRHSLF